MEIQKIDILAESIRKKGLIVNSENLVIESLFYNFGTLSEQDANECLWKKREILEQKTKTAGYSNFGICPSSIAFLSWTGELTN